MCLEVENNTKLNEFNTNSKKGPWLVWYYAKWCGHCSDMVPEWSKLGENNVHKVNLAKVSEEFIPKVKCDAPVQGYPTIVLYKNGNVLGVHSGDRSADSFNDYIKNNINAKPQANNNNSGINTNDNADADVDADADTDPEPDTGVNSGLNSLLNLFTKKNTGVAEPEKKKNKKKRKKKATKKKATKKKATKKKATPPKKKKTAKKKKKTSNNNNNSRRNNNNNNRNNNSALMPNSM